MLMNAEDALTVSPSFAAAARRGSMSSQKPEARLYFSTGTGGKWCL